MLRPLLLLFTFTLHAPHAFAFGRKPVQFQPPSTTQVIQVFQGTPSPTELVTKNIYRGSYPSSEQAVESLARLGIRTVIDLQGGGSNTSFLPGENAAEIQQERNRVQGLGMLFYNLPVNTLTPLSNSDKARVIQIAGMMDSPQLQPVFVHCSVGVDRTGVVVAAYRILYQGCPFRQAYEEMIRHGKPWTPLVTASQISFLQYLSRNQRSITGNVRYSCPLHYN